MRFSVRVAEAAVQHRHAAAKAGRKLAGHRGGQVNLRNEHQRRAAALQGQLDGPQVDLRLAAAGHAMEQKYAELAGRHLLADVLECSLLQGIELVRDGPFRLRCPLQLRLPAGRRPAVHRVLIGNPPAPTQLRDKR